MHGNASDLMQPSIYTLNVKKEPDRRVVDEDRLNRGNKGM